MSSLEDLQAYFPLRSVKDIVSITAYEVEKDYPRLSVLSIIFGWIEDQLTTCKSAKVGESELFPVLTWNNFHLLYNEFETMISCLVNGVVSLPNNDAEAIRKVADFVWSKLSKAYFKDKPHIQSVFSFLKVKQLDCFGVAITVLSILRHCGFTKINLVLSEDHSWLSFGSEGTAEVTVHGKGSEKKRGKSIEFCSTVDITTSWLYLGNNAMKCSLKMEACAVVNALNPSINSKVDSELLGKIQQEVLWSFHKLGILDRFPIGLCNLADLEEIEPSGLQPCTIEELYEKALDCVTTTYSNSQIYPYTYYAGYLYRKKMFKPAITIWMKAAEVVSKYNYSKDDEEIYKEFSEILNTFLVDIIKNGQFKDLNTDDTFTTFILLFHYLCVWEEGSKTPIFHESWSKSMMKILSAFDEDVRVAQSSHLLINFNVQKQPQSNGHFQFEIFIDEWSTKTREVLKLCSQKKLNASALRLQVCAQMNFKNSDDADGNSRRLKRRKIF